MSNVANAANTVANVAANVAAANGANSKVANSVGNAAGQAVASGNAAKAPAAAANAALANGLTPAGANAVGNAVANAIPKFPGPPNAPNGQANFQGAPANNSGAPVSALGKLGNGSNAPPLADALVDPQARPADGRLGSYVPADTYLHGATIESGELSRSLMSRPKLGAACAESDRGCTLFRGPADAAPAKPVASLFPLALESGDGFDQVLVDAPMDLIYADQLMGEDVNVLTTTRNQSWDLRGEPAIEAIYTLDKFGVSEPGSSGGAYTPDLGPYQLRAPVRQFIA